VEGEGELEVEDKPDMWAPPVGERERERRRGGRWWAVGPEVERPAGFGWAGGVRRWVGFVFFLFFSFFFKFFSNLFQTLFKFKSFTQISTSILRLLKPHHSQNSCIQIMMHKHLLLQNY
jgi:hypothetical protein